MARFRYGRRWSALLPALLGLLLLGAAQNCERHVAVYGLTADSTFQEGCFPPLLCPSLAASDLGGTFRLVERSRPSPSSFRVFAVKDVFWLARFGGEDIPVTGSGTYRIGGEFALEHQLELELQVGEREPERFDSGFVPVEGPGFPAIDIRISINGEMLFDTVIDVRAVPFPARELVETPCGPVLHCDAATEICVARTPIGPAIVYECQPTPVGCEKDRSCGCAGEALCAAPFDFCREPAKNTLECQCLRCQ